jgi:small-conductance mechanosensitive channel/CRP-like cAMP-binding protein
MDSFKQLFYSSAAFAWSDETPYLVGLVVAAAVLLFRFQPHDRRTLGNTLLFYLASMTGQLASGIFFATGFQATAAALQEVFLIASGIAIIRLLGLLLFRLLLPLLRRGSPRIVEDILVMAAYVIWGLVRLRLAGMNVGELVTASAVITAVIAFAMQDTLGNILGGLAIELDNSIAIGDWIKVDDVTGCVTDIRWRSTSVETRNWETVVIPNGVLMKSKFQVLGKREGQPVQWRRWIYFEIDPSVAPGRVIAIADTAMADAEIPNVALHPRPNCILLAFEQGNLRYAVRYWLTDLAHDDPTDSTVRQHIFTALQRAGIRLSEPEQTVHMIEEDERHQESAKNRELQRRLQSLKSVDLFAKLTKEEMQFLAESLVYAPFSRGDTMTRQGNVAHWLYILVAGEAEVVLETGSGGRTKVGVLPAGSLFGEMGLMTGAPRTATVIALSDVECYRLDKASFATILQSRPELAEDMTHVLIARRGGLEAVRAGQEAALDAARAAREHGELLGTIKRFFGLA